MWRRTALVGAVLALALTGTTVARADATLTLAEPSGPHRIGRAVLHLTDTGRPDPWVPAGDRELMVSLWYPARTPSKVPAPYMTPAESKLYLEADQPDLPSDLFSKVVTHSTVDAEPLRERGGLPLVVLSPGFGLPRATLTGLAEELASRGYAVAGIGHNYEAAATSFPDGHTTSCVVCADRDYPRIGAVRAEDVSFVLDQLTGRHPAWPGGVPIDTGRTAMIGHSAGGFSTIPAMLRDPRVKAAVNMDGNFRYPNDIPVDRPMLMLGGPGHVPAGQDPTWGKTWTQLTGWKRWLTVDDIGHLSFTDLAPLAEQQGIPLQHLDGARVDTIIRAYLTAFVDTHLRHTSTPLLNGPSPCFPEVHFHRP
ncbi:alpha/beta hydrolase [Amycolatopsis minnesotensis]|uniref:Alpha/beta hydrolase n=1 Tax=Amycolatopsis minnesotensis TaxID=337894 RepID=A0ABP5DIB0_9PSEU